MAYSDIVTTTKALTCNLDKTASQTFTYTSSAVFVLIDSNVSSISSVTKNGAALTVTSQYTFSTATNAVTITAALVAGDSIVITYVYNKYSTTEYQEYIRTALALIRVYGANNFDYNLVSSNIYPAPTKKTEDFIALIASIWMKPDYNSYRAPNIAVSYPRNLCKEDRVIMEVRNFFRGIGYFGLIDYSESTEEFDD